jgi:hypothetical protein
MYNSEKGYAFFSHASIVDKKQGEIVCAAIT